MFKLISWNVAGRRRKLPAQVVELGSRHPDLIALQETTLKSAERWGRAFTDPHNGAHLPHVLDTADRLSGRKYCNLLASRWPLQVLDPLDIPLPERVLSAVVEVGDLVPGGEIEVHVAHLPPGVTRGLAKVETFEAINERLARPSQRPRILCGDFNTPRAETPEGETTFFGQRHRAHLERWQNAERSVITGLAEYDLPDVYRQVNGYENAGTPEELSWMWRRRDRSGGRRFDHVFASDSLGATECSYIHQWRENGLSDHSAIEALFEPPST